MGKSLPLGCPAVRARYPTRLRSHEGLSSHSGARQGRYEGCTAKRGVAEGPSYYGWGGGCTIVQSLGQFTYVENDISRCGALFLWHYYCGVVRIGFAL